MLEVNSVPVRVSKSSEAYTKKQLLSVQQNNVIIINKKKPNRFLTETQEIEFFSLIVAQ